MAGMGKILEAKDSTKSENVCLDLGPRQTSDQLQQIAESPRCAPCDDPEETNFHAIRDCPKAKKVWAHFIPPDFEQKFYSLSLK